MINDKHRQDYLNHVFQELMDNLEFWDVEENLSLKKD